MEISGLVLLHHETESARPPLDFSLRLGRFLESAFCLIGVQAHPSPQKKQVPRTKNQIPVSGLVLGIWFLELGFGTWYLEFGSWDFASSRLSFSGGALALGNARFHDSGRLGFFFRLGHAFLERLHQVDDVRPFVRRRRHDFLA